jgi:hypothetical protein
MKYRKKPVVVDAWLISELVDDYLHLRMLPEEVSRETAAGKLRFVRNGIYISTREGGMFGRLEDVLIMSVEGEFYPCKPDIFSATYEKAE